MNKDKMRKEKKRVKRELKEEGFRESPTGVCVCFFSSLYRCVMSESVSDCSHIPNINKVRICLANIVRYKLLRIMPQGSAE
jgi:hypothetical protein